MTALTSAAVLTSSPAQALAEPAGKPQAAADSLFTAPPTVSVRGGDLVDASTGG